MINALLNWFHRSGLEWANVIIMRIAYRLKIGKSVSVSFRKEMRAYEVRMSDFTYMTPGPGWAYSHSYLSKILSKTFCYKYTPVAGDTVIDVGAGLGEETAIFSRLVGANGLVVAIEANPATFSALEYMCEANGLTNTKPIHCAIYSENGTIDIEDNDENYLINTVGSSTQHSVKVVARTLDSIVEEFKINKVDFLKVNIEGAEQFMLKGMTDSIGRIRKMCVSCHDFRHFNNGESVFYVTKDKVVNFLIQHGFIVETRETGDALLDSYVYATHGNYLVN